MALKIRVFGLATVETWSVITASGMREQDGYTRLMPHLVLVSNTGSVCEFSNRRWDWRNASDSQTEGM